jgi:hypothetical protein
MNFSVTVTNESGIISSVNFVNFADAAEQFETFPLVDGQTIVIRRLKDDTIVQSFRAETTRYHVAA